MADTDYRPIIGASLVWDIYYMQASNGKHDKQIDPVRAYV
jgi:hypothetical protein